jgi:hypothetical protein
MIDPFENGVDVEQHPFGVPAGGNKLGLKRCPFCKSEGTELKHQDGTPERFFMFCDELSAREYMISGLCQPCQDKTFQPHPEDDE